MRPWLVLALATAGSVAGAFHQPWAMPAAVLLLAAAMALAARAPELLLPVLLPLAFMLGPAPASIGWRELLYVAVALMAGAGTAARFPADTVAFLRRSWWWLAATVVFLGANLVSARAHAVPIADWLRGLAPFLFLLIVVPATVALRRQPALLMPFAASALAASLLYAGGTMFQFVRYGLWEHIPLDGMDPTVLLAPAGVEPEDLFYVRRVSLLFPRSIDVLVPLALVWSAWLAVWARDRWWRIAALAIGAMTVVAILVTYTRSMLLVAGIVVGLLLLDGLFVGRRRWSIAFGATIAAALLAALVAFDMGHVYLERLQRLAGGLAGNEVQTSLGAGQLRETSDINVAIRLQEWTVALELFRASPVAGAGLGIKHTITYRLNDKSETQTKHVAYVHSWPFYILMVGGVLGAIGYSAILLGPLVPARRLPQPWHRLVWATVLLMAGYGLFFAVFRLLPFNLLLGTLWAVVNAGAADDALTEDASPAR